MWIRLTFYNGDPIVINFDKVEAFGLSTDNGANSYVSVADASYHVKETVDEIVTKLSTMQQSKAWK